MSTSLKKSKKLWEKKCLYLYLIFFLLHALKMNKYQRVFFFFKKSLELFYIPTEYADLVDFYKKLNCNGTNVNKLADEVSKLRKSLRSYPFTPHKNRLLQEKLWHFFKKIGRLKTKISYNFLVFGGNCPTENFRLFQTKSDWNLVVPTKRSFNLLKKSRLK